MRRVGIRMGTVTDTGTAIRMTTITAMCTDPTADTITTTTTITRRRHLPSCSSIKPAPEQPVSAFTPGLLQLIWLASPALPVGGFSYSEGLESAVEWAGVDTEARASDWIVAQLQLTLARCDLPVLLQAVTAARAADRPRLEQLDAWVRQTRETLEFRLQTEQMGRSLADWLRGLHPEDAGLFDGWQPTYPVAFAVAAARTEASATDIGAAFCFGWAENMVQTAIKSVPLGQSAGQRMLHRLAGEIPAALAHAATLDDDGRQALSPMLAILSARHETQYSRLFRS